MKWAKAIAKIEAALAADRNVVIEYHRKWILQDSHVDTVESITEYEYEGRIYKAVNTFSDQINESSHIIDGVAVVVKGN